MMANEVLSAVNRACEYAVVSPSDESTTPLICKKNAFDVTRRYGGPRESGSPLVDHTGVA